MNSLYIKNSKGEYTPISIDKVITKDWDNQLVVIRIGTDEHPADQSEAEDAVRELNNADVLDNIRTSFLVTLYGVDFEILGSIKEVGDKYVGVRITAGDDLNKLGALQQEAKKQLRNKTKKVIILPAPLSVSEYKEVMDIKHRCDIRKQRRGS